MAINSGILQNLNVLIQTDYKAIRKEVCWTLSNFIVGSPELVQSCLDIGIIDKTIQIALNDDAEIKKEAVWALANCTIDATFDQIAALVDKGILKPLLASLKMLEANIL